MSRFTDTLKRDLEVIADRATPSPDAWAQIQSRIADQDPIQETEIIMLTENTLTRKRWPLVAAAAAVVALAITGIALVNRGDDAEQPADVPTPTVAPAPDPETGADEQQGSVGDVSPLPAEGETLAPGRYSPFTLGLPVTFEVPETSATWTVQVHDDIAVTIGPDGSFVNMSRLGSLYDAEQSEDPDFTGLGSIPPDDVDAWIEANGVVVDDSSEVTIDGRSAKLRHVRAPASAGQQSCPPEMQPCVKLSSASADQQDTWNVASVVAYGPLPHSFWIVELDDFEPLGIWVHTDTGEPQSWFDDVQPLIDSIELGEPAPATEFGGARLSTFGAGANDALPEAGQQVAPGTYSTDAIGTPVTIDIQDGQTGPWTLVSNDQTGIQLISDETGREFMAIGRVGSWFDADEARTEGTRGLGSIPADGMDTWIEANGVIVVDSAEVQVGGRDASYRLIRLDTTPGATADFCPEGEAPCLWAASGSADLVDDESTPVPFGRDRVQALWSVDMGDFEPVFIFAAANLDDDGPWFTDTVQPMVDSIVFGEPAPVIPGGTARLSTSDAGDESTALALPRPGGTVEPGQYASDALGLSAEFELGVGQTAPWNVMMEEPGRLWLISDGSDQEIFAIGRLGSWYDAVEARTEDTTGLGSIPPDDIDGWIAQNDIIVVDSEEVEVGGRPAKYRRFRLDTTPGATADFCGDSAPCLWASTGSPDIVGGTANPIEVGFDRAQSIWLVDMDEFEPVYIFAAAQFGDDGDQQWIDDVVQPIVDSFQFGEPAPVIEGGTARLPERVALTATMTVTQTGQPNVSEPWPVERTGSLEGDITGPFTGTGVSSPNGAEVTLDWTLDATIDGLGTGTLSLRSVWFWSGDGAATATDHVLGGTGDFEGVTGFGTTTQTSEPGDSADGSFTADVELMLAPPRSG